MTKTAFLAAYREAVLRAYGASWAADSAKLDRFMASAEATVRGEANTWNKDSDCTREAWRAIGGKGTPTYKALRALAD